jgi:hypothetical protein
MSRIRLLFFLLAGLTITGCGQAEPKRADAETARKTLREALDAWRSGESPDALQGRSPPIYVAEREWKNGAKLAAFEADPRDELFGSDLRCHVALTLQDSAGTSRKKRATYSVGTNNKLTVVREDDD